MLPQVSCLFLSPTEVLRQSPLRPLGDAATAAEFAIDGARPRHGAGLGLYLDRGISTFFDFAAFIGSIELGSELAKPRVSTSGQGNNVG